MTVPLDGTGRISVCQKGVLDDGTNGSRTCGINYAYAGGEFGYYYNLYIPLTPRVGNNSAIYHTIWGQANWVRGGQHLTAGGAGDTQVVARTAETTGSAGVQVDPAGARAVGAADLPTALRSEVAVLGAARAKDGTVTAQVTPDDRVFLKSTADAVCIGAGKIDGILSCGGFDDVSAGDVSGAVICGHNLASNRVAVYGVVPDGVPWVEARAADGTVIATASVKANTYRFDLAKSVAIGVETFAWSGGGASGSVNPLPSDLGCQD